MKGIKDLWMKQHRKVLSPDRGAGKREMKNDYKEKPVVENNHFVSEREQDSLAHGWGMKIIEQIVEKYQGELSIRVDMQVSIKILLDVQ